MNYENEHPGRHNGDKAASTMHRAAKRIVSRNLKSKITRDQFSTGGGGTVSETFLFRRIVVHG